MKTNTEHMRDFEERCRDILQEPLSQCTEPQQEMFRRMYTTIGLIEFAKLPWAYSQIMRSLDKNAPKGEEDQ